ncbi:LOW QUALITY PROTEIN: hypothetical protein Sjap_010806 [Stephania japonica]|uniref:EF-hand domain-containing protein n=1 Tax=Stephania japonica TaxID=461633 RepID=A0AAP0JA24_9MAGN
MKTGCVEYDANNEEIPTYSTAMSGYNNPPPPGPHGYGYAYAYSPGAPPPGQPPYAASPYGAPPPPTANPYAPAPSAYGAPPPQQPYSQPPSHPGDKPHKHESAASYHTAAAAAAAAEGIRGRGRGRTGARSRRWCRRRSRRGRIRAWWRIADQDGSGMIDDKELQRALSSYNQSFSLRTVHLLMYTFTATNSRKIGPKEFTQVFYSLQNWRAIFERFDRDRSGRIDASELQEALLSLGYTVSPDVLDLLVSKFDKTGGKSKAIEYDNFIEELKSCMGIVKLQDCCMRSNCNKVFSDVQPPHSSSSSSFHDRRNIDELIID